MCICEGEHIIQCSVELYPPLALFECESTGCLDVYEDGSYLYFSPRASILSFASFSAHVCMLDRIGQFPCMGEAAAHVVSGL